MEEKNIILFERYAGVRFVLERSLSKYQDKINIHSSHWKEDVKKLIDNNDTDLLITELNNADSDGLEISRYARKHFPDLPIIWITVMGCHECREQQEKLNILQCIEKPLEIEEFRKGILEVLKT
jgi:DNA-binding NtrC family response regulator